MLDKAVEFLDTTALDKPFFLYYPSPIPHVSLQIPDSLVDEYRTEFKEEPYLGKKRIYCSSIS
jgi:arylsulfatase